MSSALAPARFSALAAPASRSALGREATRRVCARSRARVSAPANRRRAGRFVPRASSDDAEDLTTGLAHAEYLRSVAAIAPPAELGALVAVLRAQGGTPVAPAALASRAARTTPGSLGRTYKRWSAEEEAYFLGLCEKHGEGKWAQMLAEGQRAGKLRADLTSVHLKDKYRNLKTKRATRRPSRA